MANVLDNILWESLTTDQARFAVGSGGVRRYAPGFSPIVGFEDVERPDLALLAGYCTPGEAFYTGGWSGPVTDGWLLDEESNMFRMVWDGELPAEPDLEVVQLGPHHAERALELAALTHPGPFGLRTLELGDYFGVCGGDRLMAMAGERMSAGGYREISGVCTHPDFQGRGLARMLMNILIRRQVGRGEIPFLHVMSENDLAHGLYLRMGFKDYVETVVRVISRPS